MRRRIHLGVKKAKEIKRFLQCIHLSKAPIFEEILPKAPIYEEIGPTGGERQTSESRAYESFKEVAKQRPGEGLNLRSNPLYDHMSPRASVTSL